jgi:hypothetical protein
MAMLNTWKSIWQFGCAMQVMAYGKLKYASLSKAYLIVFYGD